ncbi:hypothetical protein [Ideonella sp.]|jgi:hypothetical protein|uniref:hypothetical protein n=1 Tax=Ideonella sp. TaxID=1929293 RepID=UPI0037BE6552
MPSPSIHLERAPWLQGPQQRYILSVDDGLSRTAKLVGQHLVQHMQCESHAQIEASWVNQSRNLKSWVLRFASGASLAALVDERDELIELDAHGFVLTSPQPQAAMPVDPLHLQDCL